MTDSTMKERRNSWWKLPAAIVFWIAVWQAVSMLVAQELLVPAPLAVLKVLWRLAGTAVFWQSIGLSMLRVVAGFLLALLCGSLFAVLTERFALADALLSPMLRLIRAVPVASFIILALVWLKSTLLPAFIAWMMVTPMVWENVRQGIRQTDRQLLEMARVYRFGRWRTFLRVRVPSVLPYFLAACTTGLGFAWKSAIAAEVISRPAVSIGRRLQDAKVYLETPELFAWTAVVIVCSLLLEKLFVFLVRRGGRSFLRRGRGEN